MVLTVGQAGLPGFAVSDLRVSFRVKMSRSSIPNTAEIKVWNMNPVTIAALEAGPFPTVLLAVGYGDPLDPTGLAGVPRLIFRGDVVQDGLRLTFESTDRVLTISAQDGGTAYQTTQVSLVFPGPVSVSAAVAAVAAQLLLPIGNITVVQDVVLTQGATFTGAARDVLDRLARTANADWYITDGVFFFTPRGVPQPGEATLFSSIQGNLIGTPQKKDRGGIELKALLVASMRPGLPFVVQSRSINGPFIATDVTFAGDSGFENPFFVQTIGAPPGL